MQRMRVYRALSRAFPSSYRAKLMAVVLTCTLLPLGVFVLWLLANNGAEPERLLAGAALALAVTLIGTLVSLLLIYQLLTPLRSAAAAIDDYYREQKLPNLPEVGKDEVGRLLRGINCGLRSIHAGVGELERHASQDALTSAMNRRGCERALADSVAAAERDGTPFALYVVDLDNLKQINDGLGHAAGDRLLVTLVERARGWLGPRDWIGRWGGDEFLIGVHGPIGAANAKVQHWLDDIGAQREGRLAVRASVGCAGHRAGDGATTLYREADMAMYEAKTTGGHKLVCRCVSETVTADRKDAAVSTLATPAHL